MDDYLLETLIKNTDTVGKFKGHLEILGLHIQTLIKTIDSHIKSETDELKDIRKEAREISDKVKQMNTLLEASPIREMVDRQKNSYAFFEKKTNDTFSKLDRISLLISQVSESLSGMSKCQEMAKEMSEWVKNQKVSSVEDVKGKWAMRIIVISSISLVMKEVITSILK